MAYKSKFFQSGKQNYVSGASGLSVSKTSERDDREKWERQVDLSGMTGKQSAGSKLNPQSIAQSIADEHNRNENVREIGLADRITRDHDLTENVRAVRMPDSLSMLRTTGSIADRVRDYQNAAAISAEHDMQEDVRGAALRILAENVSREHDWNEDAKTPESRRMRAAAYADELTRGIQAGTMSEDERRRLADQMRWEATSGNLIENHFNNTDAFSEEELIQLSRLFNLATRGRVENAMAGIGSGIAANLSAIPTGIAQDASDWAKYRDQYGDGYWTDFFTKPMSEVRNGQVEAGLAGRPIDEDSLTRQLYGVSQEQKNAATAGLSENGIAGTKYFSPKWLAEQGISIAENAPNMLLTAMNPAVGTAYMVGNAGGGRALELSEQGVNAGEAVQRGLVSGAIEALTERYSIENFLDAFANNKGALINILSQMGVEASEESASYVLNYVADLAARDPNAEFTVAELIDSAMGGAFSGGIYGGIGQVGRAVGRAASRSDQRQTQNQPVQQRTAPAASAQAVQEATAPVESVVDRALREQAERGSISNSTASAILEDSDAMDALGVRTDNSMTKSQQRAAVKETVRSRQNAQESAVSETGNEASPDTENAVQAEKPRTVDTSDAVREVAAAVQDTPLTREVVEADLAALDAARGVLGENGAKSIRALYDGRQGTIGADELYRSYLPYYEAGVNGRDVSTVDTRYRGVLNEVETKIAYEAGQMDAAKSLRAEQAAAPGVIVYDKKTAGATAQTGVKVDRNTMRTLDGAAKALGVKIVVEQQLDGGANGYIRNGEIHISASAQNPILVVAAHEITHRMQEMSPKAYREYRDYVMNALSTARGGSVASLVQSKIDTYQRSQVNAGRGQALTAEQAMDELAADFTREMMNKTDLFERFAKQNRTAAQKLLDAVRSFIRKVKSLFPKNRAAQNAAAQAEFGADMDILVQAENLWSKTIMSAQSIENKITHNGLPVKKRFSLSDPVEQTDRLVALHNLSERKLLGDLKLGGIPMPSIAITLAENGHSDYGDISLVFGKETIDPQFIKKNKVYSGDAWTPKFPNVEYEVNDNKVYNVRNILYSMVDRDTLSQFGNLGINSSNIEDGLNRNDGDIAAVFRYNYGMKYAYLASTNQNLALPTKEKALGVNSGHGNNVIIAVCEQLGTDLVRELREEGWTRYKEDQDMVKRVESIINATYNNEFGLQGEILFKDLSFSEYDSLISDAARYADYGQGMVGYELDIRAAKEEIDNFIDQGAYEKWVSDLFDGVVSAIGIRNKKDPYTPSGNRRSFKALHYELNLENVVKAMREDVQKGGDAFFGGNAIWGVATRDYGSLDEIRADSGRLSKLSEEEFSEIRQKYSERLSEICDEIKSEHERNQFIAMDEAADALVEVLRTKRTVKSVDKALREYRHLNIQDDTAQKALDLIHDIQNMPTRYFEAKPQRAVGFDEVLAAVVPNDTSDALLSELKKQGVRVIPYDRGNDASRINAVNSVDGARFSISEDSDGKNEDDLHSVTEQAREINRLRAQLERAREQTKRTGTYSVNKRKVSQTARAIFDRYSSDLSGTETESAITKLYSEMEKSLNRGSVDYDELRGKARQIAEQIAIASEETSDDAAVYNELRKTLRNTGISISDADKADIPDFNSFRKRNFGRLNITKDGMPVDEFYVHLSEAFPEFFDIENETHPAEQLQRIAEVYEEISGRKTRNLFGDDIDSAIEDITSDIIGSFFTIPHAKQTFADRQAGKLEAARADAKQAKAELAELTRQYDRDTAALEKTRSRAMEALEETRTAHAREVQKLRDRFAERTKAGRDRQNERELRNKITKHVDKLSRKLLQPTDKQHVPEALRPVIAKALASIDLSSKNGRETKRTQAFLELRSEYAKIAGEDSGMVVDPDLLAQDGLLDQVARMGDTRIADMNGEQLQTVWKTVRALEHAVVTAGKLLAGQKYANTEAWAEALSNDTKTRRVKVPSGMKIGAAAKFFNKRAVDLETPYTFFSHYGDAGKSIYRMLRNAQDEQQTKIDHITDAVGRIVDEKTVRKLQKETHRFDVDGRTLTLTTAHIMELYELSKREQAMDHLMRGGIIQPEVKSAHIPRGTQALPMDIVKVGEIVGTLNDEQKQIADGLQNLMTTTLADWGNEASMKAYGYKKFTGADYWPIKTAKEERKKNADNNPNNTRSIKNIGMAKNTVPHASNALDLAGVFQTFAGHATDMIDYSTWLCPMEDANRLFNYQYRDANGFKTGRSVAGLLDEYGGSAAQGYWSNLMIDIQNGIGEKNDSFMVKDIAKLTTAAKASAVGANVRVIIQQPTAILRAMTVLDPQYLVGGMVKGKTSGNGWKKAVRYAPIAARKAQGGFEIKNQRQMGEILFNDRSSLNKFNDAMTWAAGKADEITWGKIWNACERQVKAQDKSIDMRTDAFNQKVAELFTEVIDQTQVVDGVLQRSQAMRSSQVIAKQATSFMGEPTQSLNIMLRAWDGVRNETDSKKRGNAMKVASRAAFALICTDVVNALAQSLVDALRDDDEDKKYLERVWSAFTGITGDEEEWTEYATNILFGNLVSGMNPLNRFPYAKDVLSTIQGYTVERMDTSGIADFIQVASDIASLTGNGKKTQRYAVKQLVTTGSKLFGISAANLLRDVWAIARSVVIERDDNQSLYAMQKQVFRIGDDRNKKLYLDLAFKAQQDGDIDVVDEIADELISLGILDDREKFDEALYDRLEKKYMDTDEYEKKYSETLNAIGNALDQTGDYMDRGGKFQSNAMKRAKSYAKSTALREVDPNGELSESYDDLEKYDEAIKYGLTPEEMILFDVAYLALLDEREEWAESHKDEKPETTRKEDVIDMLEEMAWLTNKERSYLYISKGYSEKNNPF